MKTLNRTLAALLVTGTLAMVFANRADAQSPYAVTTTVTRPAVVGYQAEPYGLFGFQTYYRPVYGASTTTTVSRPVVTQVAVPAPLPVPSAVSVPTPVALPATVAVPTPVVVPSPVVLPTTTVTVPSYSVF